MTLRPTVLYLQTVVDGEWSNQSLARDHGDHGDNAETWQRYEQVSQECDARFGRKRPWRAVRLDDAGAVEVLWQNDRAAMHPEAREKNEAERQRKVNRAGELETYVALTKIVLDRNYTMCAGDSLLVDNGQIVDVLNGETGRSRLRYRGNRVRPFHGTQSPEERRAWQDRIITAIREGARTSGELRYALGIPVDFTPGSDYQRLVSVLQTLHKQRPEVERYDVGTTNHNASWRYHIKKENTR